MYPNRGNCRIVRHLQGGAVRVRVGTMRFPNLATHQKMPKTRRFAVLVPLWLVLAGAAGAAAQATPSAQTAAPGEPAPLLEIQPDAAVQAPATAAPVAGADV